MDDNTTAPQTRRCPTCGADMPQDARVCGACGTESLPTVASETPAAAEQAPASAPSAPSVPPPPVAAIPATAPAAATGDTRICAWCGASNPLDAASCVACGAVFPTPEGDEALERAARARIQSMEADIKPVKAGWWPFRSRGA